MVCAECSDPYDDPGAGSFGGEGVDVLTWADLAAVLIQTEVCHESPEWIFKNLDRWQVKHIYLRKMFDKNGKLSPKPKRTYKSQAAPRDKKKAFYAFWRDMGGLHESVVDRMWQRIENEAAGKRQAESNRAKSGHARRSKHWGRY